MPPKKRKAASMAEDEDEQPKPKLSKKEIRAQAIERARLSMQGDKKKVESIKARKAGKSPSTIDKETGTARKRRKTEATEEAEVAPAPAKPAQKAKTASSPKRKAAKSKTKAAATPAKDKDLEPLPVNAPTAQMTSPQAQMLSQATGATAFAEQGFGGTNMSNQTLMNQLLLQQQQQQLYEQHMYGYGSQAAYGSPQYTMPYNGYPPQQTAAYGAAYQSQFGQANPGISQFYGARVEQRDQMQLAGNGSQSQLDQADAPNRSPAKVSSTKPAKAPPKKTANPTKTPFAAPPAVPDDDEDMPPPPPSLEVQISQQVMANMAASEQNQPTPHTRPPPEAFEVSQMDDDGEEEEVIDEDPIVIDEDCHSVPTASTPTSKYKLFFGACLAAILSYVIMKVDGTLESAPGATPCFKDNMGVGENGEIMNSCTETEGVECPDGGSCMYGKLVKCPSKHYRITENKDDCVLTDVSMKSVTIIQDVLEQWTLEQGCHLAATEYPMFAYDKVQLANPSVLAINPLELSILENQFRTERRERDLYIGLPSDFKLNAPFTCQIASALKTITGGFASVCIAGIHFILAIILEFFLAYPLITTVGLAFLYLIRRILKYRADRKKLARDVDEMRKFAYEYLEDSPGESHVVLHIRDHIVVNLFPKSQRQYLIKEVWPRVVPELKYDNRVRKSTKVVMGQPRDVWQWVAAVKPKKQTTNIQ